jgi:hypothetical protein
MEFFIKMAFVVQSVRNHSRTIFFRKKVPRFLLLQWGICFTFFIFKYLNIFLFTFYIYAYCCSLFHSTSSGSALAKLKASGSGGLLKPQQGEKKETPQERLKRIMNKQLNKQSMTI